MAAEFWRMEQNLMFQLLVVISLFGLSSSDGYSCNCDCGPNAGGGRCSLLLPSVEYLKSGGACQAIELGTRTQDCIRNKHMEDETICWSMPTTACMCREPEGNYNLMCECDGNRGIFCGSEQNNCVCTLLVADKNVALAIGIGVGSSVVGIFVLTFIITIIYFIRKAQQAKDPWYQFDKQFKKFMVIKAKQKAAGNTRPPRKARPHDSAHSAPSSSEDTSTKAEANIGPNQEPLIYATPDKSKSRSPPTAGGRRHSNADPLNWLLAQKTDSTEQLEKEPSADVDQNSATNPDLSSGVYSSTLPLPNKANAESDRIKPKYNLRSSTRASSTLPPASNQHTESAVVHHETGFVNRGYETGIYESLD